MGDTWKIAKTIKIAITPLLVALALFSCTKKPTEGTICVVNLLDNSPMAGASVKMTIKGDNGNEGFFLCNEGFVTERTVQTGSGGCITVCFQHPSVVSLEVEHTDGNGQKRTGVGTLSLVQEETQKTTVKVN